MPKGYTSNVPDSEVIAGVVPLLEQAERDGLWFFSDYQQLWFSPQELRKQQEDGYFVWGAGCWHLRSPYEYLDELNQKQVEIQRKIQQVYERMEGNKHG